jgi:hypothetical protein
MYVCTHTQGRYNNVCKGTPYCTGTHTCIMHISMPSTHEASVYRVKAHTLEARPCASPILSFDLIHCPLTLCRHFCTWNQYCITRRDIAAKRRYACLEQVAIVLFHSTKVQPQEYLLSVPFFFSSEFVKACTDQPVLGASSVIWVRHARPRMPMVLAFFLRVPGSQPSMRDEDQLTVPRNLTHVHC